jgi:two-component system, NtrC family, sensor kinase
VTLLALAGDIARRLNRPGEPREVLSDVAAVIQAGTGAQSVSIWVPHHAAETWSAVSAPPGAAVPDIVPGLALIPRSERRLRVPVLREGATIALLETEGGAEEELVRLAAELIAPYLASLRLADELDAEVAGRAREIEDERRFTGLVIDSLPVGLYVVDREYRIRVWNRKRETGTQGLRRSDVVGRTVFEVLTRQPAAQLRAEFDAIFATGQISETDLEVAAADGTRYYRISKIPMRLDGDDVSHVITIGEDVTGRRAMQQRALQTEKLAAVGQLAAGVMHEINNPLATIGACVAASEMRLTDVTGPGVAGLREYCEIIDMEVQRCTRIVDGLLDFSRPKGVAQAPADLEPIVDDALFLLKHHQRFRSLTLVREVEPELPRVRANAEQLIQVFMAVMLNAVDAMDAGGTLSVRAHRSGRPDEVVVEIEDTGIGIPLAEQGKIFEPFYTTKSPGRGTGLGLSICYGLVQEHRGRLEVTSHPGRGSVFRIVLPTLAETA